MKAIENFCAVISVDIVVSVDGNLFIGNTIKLSVSVSSLKYHIGTALLNIHTYIAGRSKLALSISPRDVRGCGLTFAIINIGRCLQSTRNGRL